MMLLQENARPRTANKTIIGSELLDRRSHSFDPVSYTHLDVYKRQNYNTIITFH